MFRLDIGCSDCNTNRLNQVVDRIWEAWNCIENGSSKDEEIFFLANYYDCYDIAVDIVFYWNGNNTEKIKEYLDKNPNLLIAVICYPESLDDNKFPFLYKGCGWKYISDGGFYILEKVNHTEWITTFIAVDDEDALKDGNSLRKMLQ